MRVMRISSLGARAAAAAGLGALLVTYGCGGTTAGAAGTQTMAANQAAGAPVIVSCEPNQRALVRPVIANGAAVLQVECVSTGEAAAYAQMGLAQPAPVAYRYVAPRTVATTRGYDLGDAQIVQAPRYPSAARPVRARQVVYADPEVRVKRGRSVKKSAIIVGSSAGVGAGVGAAVGGKKGALIGAAIGGGGAAIWDQLTRRK